jgi:hypothetical protein
MFEKQVVILSLRCRMSAAGERPCGYPDRVQSGIPRPESRIPQRKGTTTTPNAKGREAKDADEVNGKS